LLLTVRTLPAAAIGVPSTGGMYGGLRSGQPLGYPLENLVRPFQNGKVAQRESVGHALCEHITGEQLGLGVTEGQRRW
jgi:hypothetical protein